tara:strand:- start:460 stop:849 length:390 start_codon:yes stop_codon:yes gene_type:complete
MTINIPISYGEAIDKLTILDIKKTKITNQDKLKKITNEFNLLVEALSELKKDNIEEFNNFYSKLKEVNMNLWEIEDQIRICEKNKKFDNKFLELARSVYKLNDKRFDLKNKINLLFNSALAEQKHYEEY